MRISGLPREHDFDKAIYGVDGLQALELALYAAGQVLSASPEFRAGQIESWGEPAREPAALGLPLPLQALQGTLENLRAFLERSPPRKVQEDWARGLSTVMREISLDLATLAAHVPVRPRLRRRL